VDFGSAELSCKTCEEGDGFGKRYGVQVWHSLLSGCVASLARNAFLRLKRGGPGERDIMANGKAYCKQRRV
jgi:hypothetical protein